MIPKPKKVATPGNFGELLYNVRRRPPDAILDTAYKLFPDSTASKSKKELKEGEKPAKDEELSTEGGAAFADPMRGVHWQRSLG